MSKFRAVALLAGVSLMGAACGGPETEPQADKTQTWEEFRASVFQEPETGFFIYNGDEKVDSEAELRALYEQFTQGTGQLESHLAVYRTGGKDIKWTASQALNLTYCVSTGFGGNHSKVVQAMNTAAGAWEGAGKVNFVHVSAQDSNCNSRNSNVMFDVSPVNVGGQYLARAFFPNSSRSGRNVLIDASSFAASAPGLDGILRHELGHTLGFRHEHTRPEAGACFEDNNWRGLTTYDSSSVMHYPQCNGTNSWSLTMTTKDKQGTALLYP